jgi:2-hydroxychromene-2-carboxylate isomerase
LRGADPLNATQPELAAACAPSFIFEPATLPRVAVRKASPYVSAVSSVPFDPLASAAPLIVYIDYKSPYAYLAKDPTYALADELGIDVDWRPLTLDIPSYLGSARLDDKGAVVESRRTPQQWTRVKYAYHDVRRYASLRRLVVRGTTKIWDSSLAAIGMLWAKAEGPRVLRSYTDRMYERFWRRELDIENVAVIERVLGEAGAATRGFAAHAAGEGSALHDEMQRAIFDAGIFGVPTYVVDGEVLFGREHLPRVRWLLGGRRGPSPDVAYRNFSAHAEEADRARSAGPLFVAIDFKSPHAYLAFAPTCALADDLGIPIDWRPFVVTPQRKPRPLSPADDRGARHRRFRAEYEARDIARYAGARGITIRDVERRSDSALAAIGLLWTKRQKPSAVRDYVASVFRAHWQGTTDIDDPRAIASLLETLAIPAEGFDALASGAGRGDLDREQAELAEAGVFDVPTYRLEGDVFFGREHLPMIRWILAGRVGEPPI